MDNPIQVDLGRIAQDLQIRRIQVESVVQLLDEGNTVPFITRYRKERTGNLNEVVIREIQLRVQRLRELAERKETILKAIEAQGRLTPELAAAIRAAENSKRLEDLYLPYKPKKRTKASDAREKGLEPLALRIWKRDAELTDLAAAAAELVDPAKGLDSVEKVLEGVRHILSEAISELATVRDAVRKVIWKNGKLVTTKGEVPEGQGLEYRDYFNFTEPLSQVPPHRVLAINRGDKEGPLKVRVDVPRPELENALLQQLSLEGHPQSEFFREAALDALDRLILPSMEREVRRDLTEAAEKHAVEVFARNLRSLLLQPPIPRQTVMAIDPGLRSGCKVVVLDPHGNLLEQGVIYPHPPQSRRSEAKLFLKDLVAKHHVQVVAIGNGTACRETEELIAEIIAEGAQFHQQAQESGTAAAPVGPASAATEPVPETAAELQPQHPAPTASEAVPETAELQPQHPAPTASEAVSAVEEVPAMGFSTPASDHEPAAERAESSEEPSTSRDPSVATFTDATLSIARPEHEPQAHPNATAEADGNGSPEEHSEPAASAMLTEELPPLSGGSPDWAVPETEAESASRPINPLESGSSDRPDNPEPLAAPEIPPQGSCDTESPSGFPGSESAEPADAPTAALPPFESAEARHDEDSAERDAEVLDAATAEAAATPPAPAASLPSAEVPGESPPPPPPPDQSREPAVETAPPHPAEPPASELAAEQAAPLLDTEANQAAVSVAAGEPSQTAVGETPESSTGPADGGNLKPPPAIPIRSHQEGRRGSARPDHGRQRGPRPPKQPSGPPPPEIPPAPHPADPWLAQMAYVIVNEAGASVYSTSQIGREELPDCDPTVRSAISIGRRLQDPLAELVKIEPQNIGVGLYQHDVNPKHLKETLESVISSCVNFVGVDLNTASVSLLRHVSGLNQLTARRIVEYRREKGPFTSRETLMQVEGIGPATYTQAAGFLKIPEGEHPFDRTWVHPESYEVATRLLEKFGVTPEVVKDKEKLPEVRNRLAEANVAELARELETGEYTLRDIIEALGRPERDPREDLPKPIFKKGILKIEDLTPGMELKGTVLNVVDFGAFVDIGLKDSGLVHISQLANRYIKSPHDVVSIGDVVTVWVMSLDHERKRVSLTMVKPGTERQRGQGGSGGSRRGGGEPREGQPPVRRDRGRAPRPVASALTSPPVGAPPLAPSSEPPPARPEREHDRGPGRGESRPPGGGGGRHGPSSPPSHGPAQGRGGSRGQFVDDRPGSERGQQARGPSRPSRPSPPPPPLSKDALSGNVPLRTLGQLKQFWEARTQREAQTSEAQNPSTQEHSSDPPPNPAPQPEPPPRESPPPDGGSIEESTTH